MDRSSDLLALHAAPNAEGSLLSLAGELDLSSAPALETALERCARNDEGSQLVIDLSDVQFIDVAGLHSLRHGCTALVDTGHLVFVRRARARVHRVFELTRTTELFPFVG